MKTATAAVMCAAASGASAEIFYAGDTKGLPGEVVELSINARAGTVLESIDIVPAYAPVADVLQLVGLSSTPALTQDGFGFCDGGEVCGLFYLPPKTFASDTLLATLRFNIAPDAPVGPVPFDAGVIVGEDLLPIPPAQNFEVLAIPEPQHWALLAAGLAVVGAVVRRRRMA
jgi:hypothetical protein